MRRLLAVLVMAISTAAHAAALDPARLAAIDQAAKDFLTHAAEAKKSGAVPRQSDPAVGPLLDTLFDTRDLSHGALPYGDYDKLEDWARQIVRVGQVYLDAAHNFHDFGLFGPEIGRDFDALVVVLQAVADMLASQADGHPGEMPSAADTKKITGAHTEIVKNLNQVIGNGLRAPGLSVEWVRARLTVLVIAAPSFARFLKPNELAELRRTTLRVAERIREKSVRGSLGALAVAFAEPPAPMAPPAAPAPNGEIALESDGQGYSVPVRINGALTVKFLIDSGASVVALPKDLVEQLTTSGAIAESDMLGRDIYVGADGKRHRGVSLMLRRLEVSGHVVTNVMASMIPAHNPPLLGMSFLAKFKSWTLDNNRHVLVIVE